MLEAQRHRGPPVCIDGLWVCARLQQQPDTAGVAACRRPVQRSPVAVGVETVGNLGRQQVGGPQALLELSRVVQCRVDGRLVSMDAIEEPLWVGASLGCRSGACANREGDGQGSAAACKRRASLWPQLIAVRTVTVEFVKYLASVSASPEAAASLTADIRSTRQPRSRPGRMCHAAAPAFVG